MAIKINAGVRLLADREAYQENEWRSEKEQPHKPSAKSNPKEEAMKANNELIDKLRQKIKDEIVKIKDKEGSAKQAQQRLVDGLKKRANELWKKYDFTGKPLYKIEAAEPRMHEKDPDSLMIEQLRKQKENSTPSEKADLNLRIDRAKMTKDQKKQTELVQKQNQKD